MEIKDASLMFDMYLLLEEGFSLEEAAKELKVDASYDLKKMKELIDRNREEYKKLADYYTKEFQQVKLSFNLRQLRLLKSILLMYTPNPFSSDKSLYDDMLNQVKDKLRELDGENE